MRLCGGFSFETMHECGPSKSTKPDEKAEWMRVCDERAVQRGMTFSGDEERTFSGMMPG